MNHRIAAIVAVLLLAGPAAAQTEPAAVRQVIEQQLEAFRAGDAAAAYALAGPGIKRMFPSPERFIGMVRRGYKPVYDANDPVFLRGKAVGEGEYAQEVALTDDAGTAWTALYTLARQPDGSWRITGCYLRKAPGAEA